jgi:hypothetical protein
VEAETDETEYIEKFQGESIRKAEQELKEGNLSVLILLKK